MPDHVHMIRYGFKIGNAVRISVKVPPINFNDSKKTEEKSHYYILLFFT